MDNASMDIGYANRLRSQLLTSGRLFFRVRRDPLGNWKTEGQAPSKLTEFQSFFHSAMFSQSNIIRVTLFASAAWISTTRSVTATPDQPAEISGTQFGRWSEAVDDLKGRLLIEPVQNAKDRGSIRVIFEIQNLQEDALFGIKQVYFSNFACFQWELTDQFGKPVPHSDAVVGLSIAYTAYPIILPPNSTLRLPVSFGAYKIFKPFLHSLPTDPGALGFIMSPIGGPWNVAGSKTAVLYLSATFTGDRSEPKDFHAVPTMPSLRSWKGTLILPKVALPLRHD